MKKSGKTMNCVVCDKEVYVPRYRWDKFSCCSKECHNRLMTKGNGGVSRNCMFCGEEFKTSPSKPKKFCSTSCYRYHMIDENKSPMTFSTARKFMQRRGLLSVCIDCGYKEHPEIIGVHHNDGDRSNNSLENLHALCPTCHSLRHMMHIPHNTGGLNATY